MCSDEGHIQHSINRRSALQWCLLCVLLQERMWYLCLPPAPSQDPSLAPGLSDMALSSHTGALTPFLSVASGLAVIMQNVLGKMCVFMPKAEVQVQSWNRQGKHLYLLHMGGGFVVPIITTPSLPSRHASPGLSEFFQLRLACWARVWVSQRDSGCH